MRLFYRLLASILFAAVMLAVHLSPLGRTLEREYGLPLLYTLRGDIPVPRGALVVGLDNESVGWLSGQLRKGTVDSDMPQLAACLTSRARENLAGRANISQIPRAVYACTIDAIAQRGAKVIVVDVNFHRARPETGLVDEPSQDKLLIDAVARAENVLLFERLLNDRTAARMRLPPMPPLRAAALGTVGSQVDSSSGEVVTGYFTRFRYFPDLPAMPQATYRAVTGTEPPVTRDIIQPIWLYGPPNTVPTIRLKDVFDPTAETPLPADLSGLAVFVGASDPRDASIEDHFPIPTSGRGNELAGGVELAATAFLNLLHNTPLNRTGPGVEAALVFLTALIGGLAVLSLTRWTLSIAIVCLGAGYMIAATVGFTTMRIWLPVMVPVFLASALLSLTAISVRYFFARSLVERLVPRQVAAMLLQGTTPDRRAAKVEDATIMFSDLVGSTGLAEAMGELDYTRIANLYYDTATERVEAQDGMVVEFLGDGILAMFSESVSGPDHAAKACRAARALAAAIDATNNAAPDLPDLRLRIGINSGRTATGDIGARTRFNFKALGDVVNVAARLEQHGKTVEAPEGHVILVSGSTAAAAPEDEIARLPLGPLTVRGRNEAIDVYRLPA